MKFKEKDFDVKAKERYKLLAVLFKKSNSSLLNRQAKQPSVLPSRSKWCQPFFSHRRAPSCYALFVTVLAGISVRLDAKASLPTPKTEKKVRAR